tara:strand:+ start:298 stop:1398 length:1101 start_codon:yes stop_codon:yes gene_type:complete
MSSKKDSFNSSDKQYMKIAINLAKNQNGFTGLNPSVGCVVVKKNKIISYAATNINGRPHAETIALKKNKKENYGSTLYVTLEPCSHYGKTPPCTKQIIKSKIKKVIYSIEDSDIRSSNKAKKILRSKNIQVKSGLLSQEMKIFYKSYNYIKKNKFPYVIGKLACSSNSYILKNKSFITNEHSRRVSHLLRYKNQGILTSYKTINSDNPKLTCRIVGLEKFSPKRIIIDRHLKINFNSYVIKNCKNPKTIIFHNSNNFIKINKLKEKGIKLINLKIKNDSYFDLKMLLKKIYEIGIHNLLVECGEILTYKILSKNLFNEFYLFKSNKNINNKDKISILDVKKSLDKKFKNKYLVNTYLDKDTLMHYY